MENINAFKAAVSAVLAALTALWGWFGWLVVAWILCMAIDYATGSFAALRAGKWSSKIARDGIWHKVGSIVSVIVAAVMDMLVGSILAHFPGISLPFTYEVFLCPLVLAWYILTECGSIIENAGALGAPVPGWLAKTIEVFRSRIDEAGDTGSDAESQNDEGPPAEESSEK